MQQNQTNLTRARFQLQPRKVIMKLAPGKLRSLRAVFDQEALLPEPKHYECGSVIREVKISPE